MAGYWDQASECSVREGLARFLILRSQCCSRLSLEREVRRLGSDPTVEDQLKVVKKRQRLQARIDTFTKLGQSILADINNTVPLPVPQTSTGNWEDEEQSSDITAPHHTV